jgi:hypothetical protein
VAEQRREPLCSEHNGKLASAPLRARPRGFILQLESDGTQLGSSWRINMEVVTVLVGLAERVDGLVGAAQRNDKRGTMVSGPDPATGRYKVQLDNAETGVKALGLKPANLES